MLHCLTTCVRSLEHTLRWKERTDLRKVFSDLHMCTTVCTPTHMYNTHTAKAIIQKKKTQLPKD